MAGWTIVTNGLVLFSFTAFLFQAARLRDAQRSVREGLTLDEALSSAKTQHGESLPDLSRQQDLLIVCLRHAGCTYCHEALVRKYGLDETDHVSDPEPHVYRGLELRLGTLCQLFGVRNFSRALVGGTVFQFGFGRFVGNGLQMPGAFLVRDGRIAKAFRHESPSDRPDYAGVACSIG